MKNGPILLVEDDVDDQEIIIEALQALGVQNEVKTFDNGQKALDFLKIMDKQPFLIISDVNLPVMNGLQLKYEIQNNEYLRTKSIPFIFLSTSGDKKAVEEAFNLQVQGFFVKEISYEGINRQIKGIIDYWKSCRHPNFKELSDSW
ncbi:MAG TPA: response regulator [Segetibacter sp.]